MAIPNVGKVSVEAELKVDLEKARQAMSRDLFDGFGKAGQKLEEVNKQIGAIMDQVVAVSNVDLSHFAQQIADLEPPEKVVNGLKKLKEFQEEQNELRILTDELIQAEADATDRLTASNKELTKAQAALKRSSRPETIAKNEARVAAVMAEQVEEQESINELQEARVKTSERLLDLEKLIEEREIAREKWLRKAADYKAKKAEELQNKTMANIYEEAVERSKYANAYVAQLTQISNKQVSLEWQSYRERQRIRKEEQDESARIRRESEADLKRILREQERATRKARETALKPLAVSGEILRSMTGLSLGVSTEALTVMTTMGVTLVGTLGSLSKTLLALPAGIGAVTLAVQTLKMGMSGFSDTLGALADGDMDKFDHLINQLSPNAQQAALAIQKLGPVFEGFKHSIQDALFKDTPQMFSQVLSTYVPMLKEGMTGIAAQMNQFMSNAAKELLTPESQANINTLLNNTVEMFRQLAPAAKPFVQAITELMAVGSTLLPKFGANLTDLVKKFAEWVSVNADNGNITKWIEEGIRTLGSLVRLAWDFGEAVAAMAPIAEKILPVILGILTGILNVLEEVPYSIEIIAGLFFAGKLLGGIKSFGENIKVIGSLWKVLVPNAVRSGLVTIAGYLLAFTKGALAAFALAVQKAFWPLMALAGIVAGGTWLGTKIANAMTGEDLSVLERLGDVKGGLFGGPKGAEAWMGVPGMEGWATSEYQERYGIPLPTGAGAAAVGPPPVNNNAAPNTQIVNPALPPMPGAAPVTPKDVGGLLGGSTDNPVPVEVIELPKPPTPTNAPIQGPPVPGMAAPVPTVPTAPVNPGGWTDGLPPPVVDTGWGPWDNLPVPADTKDARGDAIPKPKDPKDPAEMTDAEKRRAIENDPRFSIDNYLDPTAITNAINTAPGNPGQPPLKTEVTNLPPALPVEAGYPAAAAPAAAAAAAATPTVPVITNGLLSPSAIANSRVTGSSLSSAQQGIAKSILATAVQRGYNQEQALAILATAMQESNLDPNTPAGDGGKSVGIFQQDASYGPGRTDPQQNIKMFFDKLGTKGGPQGNIWENIFLTQQMPAFNDFGAAMADPRARPGYLDEIKSQMPDARTFYQQLVKTADTAPVVAAIDTAPGNVGQPALKVEVTNWPGGFNASTSGATVALGSLPGVTDAMNANAQIDLLKSVATSGSFGDLTISSGLRPVGSTTPGSYHDSGQAGDFSNTSANTKTYADNTPEMLAFANFMSQETFRPFISELIYSDPNFKRNIIDQQYVGDGMSTYGASTMADHTNHVHIAIADGMAQAFAAVIAKIQAAGGVVPTQLTTAGQNPVVPTPTVAGQGQTPIVPTPTIPGQPLMANGKPAVLPANVTSSAPVPVSLNDPDGAINSAPILDQATGKWGYYQKNPEDIERAAQRRDEAIISLAEATRDRDIKLEQQRRGLLLDANELWEANNRIVAETNDLRAAEADLSKSNKGDFRNLPNGPSGATGKPKPFDYNSLPKGHPMRFMAGLLGGLGGDDEDIAMILGGGNPLAGAAGLAGAQAVNAAAGPLGDVAGNVVADVLAIPLPGPMGYQSTPTADSTDLNKLVQERNPNALFQAAGVPVPDYTRQGGDAGDVQQGNTAPDANGRVYSDTAALIDRTFTNLDAAEKARHDQTMAVLNEIKASLGKEVFGPAVADATTGALQGAAAQIGEAMGQTAAPPIASAVERAIPKDTGGGAGGASGVVGAVAGIVGLPGLAGGGGITGGTPGKDSVPAMLMPGEWVFTTEEVQRMGGFAGVQAFRSALARQGGLRFYASGGNVGGQDTSRTVGADFFGVSEVPVIGGLINLLIQVLLKIIGVQIEQRDTLMQVSDEFRSFRSDFTAFDAAGRLMNDTSGLTDRSSTSEEEAADERIRILKQVIEGIVKFVIEKVIVPISKAVANAVIQAGASGASGALSTLPGGSFAAPLANALITGAGQAGVEIGAEVYTVLAESIASLVIDTIGEALSSSEIGNALFGGSSAQAIDPVANVLTGAIGGITASLASIMAVLTGVFGGVSMSGSFDRGGLAVGTGLMPKATVEPERVLSPAQTRSFDRLVDALASGKTVGQSKTVIHAPFTVNGDEQGARVVHDRLLSLTS